MVDNAAETPMIYLDPDDLNDIDIPNQFDHDVDTIFVDDRVLNLAELLGRQAARAYLQLEAANDNQPHRKVKKRPLHVRVNNKRNN